MNGVAVAGDRLLAHGVAYAERADASVMEVPVMWTSDDGRSWTSVDAPPTDSIDAITGGPKGFVALRLTDVGATVWHSTDGRSWDRTESDAFASRWPVGTGGERLNDDGMPVVIDLVSAAGSRAGYMAVGGDGICAFDGPCTSDEAGIWTSPDGRTWARQPSGEPFTDAWADDPTPWGDRFLVGGVASGRPTIWLSGGE
jgi:hypothetical protein